MNEPITHQVLNQMQLIVNEMQQNIDRLRETMNQKPRTYTKSEVLQAVCRRYEITKADLLGKDFKGVKQDAKICFAHLLFYHVSRNHEEIAQWMNRGRSGIYKLLYTADSLINLNDKIFCGHIMAIKEDLNK